MNGRTGTPPMEMADTSNTSCKHAQSAPNYLHLTANPHCQSCGVWRQAALTLRQTHRTGMSVRTTYVTDGKETNHQPMDHCPLQNQNKKFWIRVLLVLSPHISVQLCCPGDVPFCMWFGLHKYKIVFTLKHLLPNPAVQIFSCFCSPW